MADLAVNPKDLFSHVTAQLVYHTCVAKLFHMKYLKKCALIIESIKKYPKRNLEAHL